VIDTEEGSGSQKASYKLLSTS